MAGEGFSTLPTIMTTEETKRLETEAKAFWKVTVLPEAEQEKFDTERELTEMERQVAEGMLV